MTDARQRIFNETTADNEGNFASRDWLLFCAISLIWGSSFLLIAESLEAFTPGIVTLGRVGLGAATVWLVRLITGSNQSIDPADWPRLVILAVVWVALPFTLFPLAQQWINSAVTGLLNGATPVLVALVSIGLVKVVPRGMQVVGLIIGSIGVALISFGSAGEGSSEALGVILVLFATTCYGFAMNIAPPMQAKYGAIVLMSNVLAIATVFTIPYALINIGDNEWQASSAIGLAFLGCVGTGLAYWIMATLVGRVGSLRASFITYLIPVVSLLLGISIRGDEVSVLALIGAPITIVGAFLASLRADSRS